MIAGWYVVALGMVGIVRIRDLGRSTSHLAGPPTRGFDVRRPWKAGVVPLGPTRSVRMHHPGRGSHAVVELVDLGPLRVGCDASMLQGHVNTPEEGMATMPRIVVGVDGSEHARRAVRTALEEADRRQAEVEAVYAVVGSGMMPDPVSQPGPRREEARAAGSEVLDEVLADVDAQTAKVERTVRIGNATRVLCEAAADAELLVVGSRGLGGFHGLLVGSVTQQVIAHSPCPVLVVVPEDRRQSG